jgi:Ca2+-binding EF-hand superfamily protein
MYRLFLGLFALSVIGGCSRSDDSTPKFDYGAAKAQTSSAGTAKPQSKPQEDWATAVIRARDKNHDGLLDFEEYTDLPDPHERRVAADVFKLSDRNKDGKLSEQELRNLPIEATFRSMDLNDDGTLDFREFFVGEMSSASIKRARRVFELVDQNHDGKISVDEYRDRPIEAWFHWRDTNEDGYISLDEFAATNPGLVRNKYLERAFRIMDRNGDGKLDVAEYCRTYDEVTFLLQDGNGDGVLTFDEYALWSYTPEVRAAMQTKFARRDSDGNGVLTFKEFASVVEDKDFWVMDKNGDYRVTRDEFIQFTINQRGFSGSAEGRASRSKESRAAELFALLDTNHDGVLTWDEFHSQSPSIRFQRMDVNADSLLSLEEYIPFGATAEERAAAEKEFRAKDKNGDGKLTVAEYVGEKR